MNVAVLSPGEMGASVGRVLAEAGKQPLTCVAGRTAESVQRAEAAGFRLLSDLKQLAAEADVIVSVVPPAAAEPLARTVAQALSSKKPLYLDANSIGPETAERICRVVTDAGAEFVDGCIIGGARDLRGRSRFYLSGAAATDAAELLAPLNVTVLGERSGQASAFKVLYAGVTKGLSAMGLELLAGAERLGVSAELMDKLRADWPNVSSFFERNLPGLPPRARRRGQEMAELGDTLEHLGIAAPLARGAQAGLEGLAERYVAEHPDEFPDVARLIAWWAQTR